jgi:hypothetical protein
MVQSTCLGVKIGRTTLAETAVSLASWGNYNLHMCDYAEAARRTPTAC